MLALQLMGGFVNSVSMNCKQWRGCISAQGKADAICTSCVTAKACAFCQAPLTQALNTPVQTRSLQAGCYLYRQGDTSRGHFHVRSGMFKTLVTNAQGHDFVSAFVLPSEVLGGVLDGHCQLESAVALETSVVCEFVVEQMSAQCRSDYSQTLIAQLSTQASRALAHRVMLNQSPVQARFAAFCVLYAKNLTRLGRQEAFLPMPMSRTDLANYLGMTLESLSRVVNQLHRAEVIKAALDRIEIVDAETLHGLAGRALL